MNKRDEYYDGEEGDGSCVGLLLIAALVVFFVLAAVVVCLLLTVAI